MLFILSSLVVKGCLFFFPFVIWSFMGTYIKHLCLGTNGADVTASDDSLHLSNYKRKPEMYCFIDDNLAVGECCGCCNALSKSFLLHLTVLFVVFKSGSNRPPFISKRRFETPPWRRDRQQDLKARAGIDVSANGTLRGRYRRVSRTYNVPPGT